MDLSDVALFRLIASTSSLSAAARELGMTAMAVSRRLSRLETAVGARLIHRTTRTLALTPDGEAFLPYADDLVRTQDAALTCIGGAGGLRGTLKVTAPNVIGREIVAPILWGMLAENPALKIDLQLTDRPLDILASGLDVAIRVGSALPSDMIATRLAESPRVLCVAPKYIERHGMPATLADLVGHACLTLHGVPAWPFAVGGGHQELRVSGPLSASSIDALRSACAAGVGIAFMTYWNVASMLADGVLTRIELRDATPLDLGMWAVFPTRRQVPARVRHLIDALRRQLSIYTE
jgi:DNA-binding transcriptional LysR family regulator